MCSRNEADVSFSLTALAEHGSSHMPHKDGWGIAYYEGHDARVIRDTTCAGSSPWVQFVEQQTLRSSLVIAHLRKATLGAIALKNTQPFIRELGGRVHVFAHNGHVPKIAKSDRFPIDAFQPIGDTDSEYAFCAMLERIKPLWYGNDRPPTIESRLDTVADFAAELRQLGPANFLYCDGEFLFVHGHRRTQSDGSINPPGLYRLCRHCVEAEPSPESTGVSIRSTDQDVVLIASVPLTDEAWQPLAEGQILALSAGSVVHET
ncbi:MAG: class II glutamine amidotransferase [Woeseiaceae bacterium]|nr:class II glutamine amidotransferase [Woeseiaceae bacterium]